MMEENLLHMKQIVKSFNLIKVLDLVDFELRKGEIHALLGENGAGKSTLMNILGGVLQPESGEVYLENQRIELTEPRVSKAYGISFIHQELNIVPDLTVYENLFLGNELTGRFGLINTDEMCNQARAVLNKLGIALDPKGYLRDLDPSYKQMIEIARALLENSKIIIMDEPTTSLAEHEVSKLFALMKALKATGVSIIYISHKLKEVLEICDHYTVLRDGKVSGTGSIQDVNEEELTSMMIGKGVAGIDYYRERKLGRPVLQINKLTDDRFFQEVSLTVHAGEILGITGLSGDGRTELVESIFGYRRGYTGEIHVHGQAQKIEHPRDAVRCGISLVPKNRKENGIITDLNVLENMSLPTLKQLSRYLFIDHKQQWSVFESYKQKLNIKVSDPSEAITSLSGGNQQKVILAKWLQADTSIMILDNPTQGIDVGARSEIYYLIMELAEQGKALIVLSSEANEILRVCDRVLVMYQGRVAASLNREEANEELIMLYATGSKSEVHSG